MGRLIGAHPEFAFVPLEARFHAAKKGLADLASGDSSLDEFLAKCRGHWFARGMKGNRGLQEIVSRDELESALERFESDYPGDPLGASRRLTREIIDPVARAQGKRSWVEVSGANIRSGPSLLKLFPRAKFVHMVRDGRAVAASVLHKDSMTDDPMRALLKHWHPRIRDSDASVRRMPPGSVLYMRLERLAADAREESYARLVDYLECGDDPAMRAYFDNQISPAAAHHGEWRERLSEEDAERVDRAYAKLLRRLHEEGNASAPSPQEVGIEPGELGIASRVRRSGAASARGLRRAGSRVTRAARRARPGR
jgi:hypothetical protein